MRPIIRFVKSSWLGGPILLCIVAGAGLLYLVFRERIYLYGVACYFVVVGGIMVVSFAMRNRRGKL